MKTNIEQPKEQTAWEEERDRLAENGRKFPYEFIDALGSNAYDTLRKWMKENGAPEEVLSILDNSVMLQIYYHDLKNGTISDGSAAEIPDLVAETTRLIALFGGYFAEPGGTTIPREAVIKWPGKSEGITTG